MLGSKITVTEAAEDALRKAFQQLTARHADICRDMELSRIRALMLSNQREAAAKEMFDLAQCLDSVAEGSVLWKTKAEHCIVRDFSSASKCAWLGANEIQVKP